jgi:hypothetical protein
MYCTQQEAKPTVNADVLLQAMGLTAADLKKKRQERKQARAGSLPIVLAWAQYQLWGRAAQRGYSCARHAEWLSMAREPHCTLLLLHRAVTAQRSTDGQREHMQQARHGAAAAGALRPGAHGRHRLKASLEAPVKRAFNPRDYPNGRVSRILLKHTASDWLTRVRRGNVVC